MTTPVISSVSGTVTTGQALTITGTHMVDESQSTWVPFHATNPTAGQMQGASLVGMGFDTPHNADWVADTSIKLFGAKSFRNHTSGQIIHTAPDNFAHAGSFSIFGPTDMGSASVTSDVWFRVYARFDVGANGEWPNTFGGGSDDFKVMSKYPGGGSDLGFWMSLDTPNSIGVPPSGIRLTPTGAIMNSHSSGPTIAENRWYCIELKAPLNSNNHIWQIYVDGTQVFSQDLGQGVNFTADPNQFYAFFVNWYSTSPAFDQFIWCNGVAAKNNSRILPSSVIEIGNSSNYATATKIYQAPEFFSDTSHQCVCNLAGLGAGPYWLFVTNNLGQTSAAFNLGGASPTLSAGFVASVTSTTGIPTVTTDTGNGTLWEVVVPNGDVPSHAQIKAGQQSSGAAALDAQSLAITSAGTKIFAAIAAQTSATPFDCYFLQSDINANDSLAFKADFTTLSGVGGGVGTGTLFISEPFENPNFSTRGWYDGVDCPVDAAVINPPGGLASLKFHWDIGTMAIANTPRRHLFQASDSFYLSWWMKLGSSASQWIGSGVAYHPHVLQVMTDAEPNEFTGPARPWLTIRIEPHDFTARISVSDGQRINIPQLGVNLLGTATPHAVAGGNGTQDASSTYFNGPLYENNFDLNSSGNVFVNNTWHFCEVYVQMNTIVGGLPLLNGIMRYWVDGALVVSASTIELRTAQYATQKFNQLLLVPYIGVGSPASQDLWVDSLLLWTARAGESGFPAVSVPSVVPRFSFVLP